MTGWGLVAYGLLPLGVALASMFLSDLKLLQYLAHQVLAAPVRLGALRLNVALLCSSLCAVLLLLSYAAVQRSRKRYEEARSGSIFDIASPFSKGLSWVFHVFFIKTWRCQAFFKSFQVATSPLWGGGSLWRLREDVPRQRAVEITAFRDKSFRKRRCHAISSFCAGVSRG